MKKILLICIIILLPFAYINPLNAFALDRCRLLVNKFRQELTPPEFPGGKRALEKYVYGNLTPPKKDGVEVSAAMLISFFVEKDGSLSGFKVEQSLSPDFDAAAIKLLSASPKWKPAMKDGNPIKSHYRLPIRYDVEHILVSDKDSVLKQ
jgi:periplasmic protein TonB